MKRANRLAHFQGAYRLGHTAAFYDEAIADCPPLMYAGLNVAPPSALRTSTLGSVAGGRVRLAMCGKQDYLRSDKKMVAYIKIKKENGVTEYSPIYKEKYKPIPSWAEKAMENYPDGVYDACIFQRDERDDIETRLLLWYPNENEVFFFESDYLGSDNEPMV